MASKFALIIFAIAFPALVSAKEFTVGDKKGWTINFDYQAWAKGKEFHVGDRLTKTAVPVGVHNVFKVNGTGFQNCIKPALSEALTTGNDTIVLATPGRKWCICGVGKHCEVGGQKLFIIVNPAALPPSVAPSHSLSAPAQALRITSSSSANEIIVTTFQSMIAVAVVIVLFFAV